MMISLWHAATIADAARGPDLFVAIHHCTGRVDTMTDVGILAQEPPHRIAIDHDLVGAKMSSISPKLGVNRVFQRGLMYHKWDYRFRQREWKRDEAIRAGVLNRNGFGTCCDEKRVHAVLEEKWFNPE